MSKLLLPVTLTCLLLSLVLLSVIPFASATVLNGARVQSSSTSTTNPLWYLSVSNMTLYYSYYDGMFNIMQDYNGTMFFNNVKNKTIPSAMARYNFDYDVYGKLIDVGIKGKRYNATWNGINRGNGTAKSTIRNATTSAFTGTWLNKENVFDNNNLTRAIPTAIADTINFNYTGIAPNSFGGTIAIIYEYYAQHIPPPPDNWVNYTYYVSIAKCYRSDNKLVFTYGVWNSTMGLVPSSNLSCTNSSSTTQLWHVHSTGRGNYPRIYGFILNTSVTAGITYYFPFEESNATKTKNWAGVPGQDGFIKSGASRNYSCKNGACYTFDGESGAINATLAASSLTTFTVAAWIKPDGCGEGNLGRIVEKGTNAVTNWQFNVRDCNGTHARIEFYRLMTPSGSVRYRTDALPTGRVKFGEWHHVAATYLDEATNTARIYIDGKEAPYSTSTTSTNEAATDTTADLIIGNDRQTGTTERTFDGSIDEVYIFNRNVTLAEIGFFANASCNSGYCPQINDRGFYNLSSNFKTGSNVTIAFWIRTPYNTWFDFFPVLKVGTPEYGYHLDVGYHTIRFTSNNSFVDFYSYTAASDDPVLPPHTWRHIIVTQSNRNVSMYLNGERKEVEFSFLGYEQKVESRGTGVALLARYGTYYLPFNGSIDRLQIFNTSINDEQAKYLYSNSLYTNNVAIGQYKAAITYYNASSQKVFTNVTSNTNVSGGTANITVYKESDNSIITGTNISIQATKNLTTFNYWTTTGKVVTSGIYTSGTWSFSFVANGYAQRNYLLTSSGTTPLQLKAYLTQYQNTTTFTAKNQYSGAILEGVTATQYKNIGGNYQVIESKMTDITGRVTFTYVANTDYRFIFVKSGYSNYIFNLNPVSFTEYDVKMTPSNTVNTTQLMDRITMNYGPREFYENRTANFGLLITSPYGELTTYGYTITYPGGSVSNNGTQAAGEQLNSTFTIVGATYADVARVLIYYSIPTSGLRNMTVNIPIIITASNNTLFAGNGKTYGLGVFERLLIAVAFAVLIAGVATMVGRPLPGLIMAMLWFFYLSFIGFIPMWSIAISIIGAIFILSSQSEL